MAYSLLPTVCVASLQCTMKWREWIRNELSMDWDEVLTVLCWRRPRTATPRERETHHLRKLSFTLRYFYYHHLDSTLPPHPSALLLYEAYVGVVVGRINRQDAFAGRPHPTRLNLVIISILAWTPHNGLCLPYALVSTSYLSA